MNIDQFKVLSDEEKTPELCLAVVSHHSFALQYVPEGLKTPELCLSAVKDNGQALEFVPEALKSPELCLSAVKNYGPALEFVPEALKTPELCLAAVQSDDYALQNVPEDVLTPEICLAALKDRCYALKLIPETFKTREICLAAVSKRAGADVLEHVPDSLKTQDFYLEAVCANAELLRSLPQDIVTPEFALAAVMKNPCLLEPLPARMKTQKLCLAAVTCNPKSLRFVPAKVKTAKFMASLEAAGIKPAVCKTAVYRPVSLAFGISREEYDAWVEQEDGAYVEVDNFPGSWPIINTYRLFAGKEAAERFIFEHEAPGVANGLSDDPLENRIWLEYEGKTLELDLGLEADGEDDETGLCGHILKAYAFIRETTPGMDSWKAVVLASAAVADDPWYEVGDFYTDSKLSPAWDDEAEAIREYTSDICDCGRPELNGDADQYALDTFLGYHISAATAELEMPDNGTIDFSTLEFDDNFYYDAEFTGFYIVVNEE